MLAAQVEALTAELQIKNAECDLFQHGCDIRDVELDRLKKQKPYRWLDDKGDTIDKADVAWFHEEHYTATPLFLAAGAQPDTKELADTTRNYLQPADLGDLMRFLETTDDGEGYDIGKQAIKRLADLGVVQSHGFGRYSMTAFGHFALEHMFKQSPSLPLMTDDDRDRAAIDSEMAAA